MFPMKAYKGENLKEIKKIFAIYLSYCQFKVDKCLRFAGFVLLSRRDMNNVHS